MAPQREFNPAFAGFFMTEAEQNRLISYNILIILNLLNI